jgi:hypothetical protein
MFLNCKNCIVYLSKCFISVLNTIEYAHFRNKLKFKTCLVEQCFYEYQLFVLCRIMLMVN